MKAMKTKVNLFEVVARDLNTGRTFGCDQLTLNTTDWYIEDICKVWPEGRWHFLILLGGEIVSDLTLDPEDITSFGTFVA